MRATVGLADIWPDRFLDQAPYECAWTSRGARLPLVTRPNGSKAPFSLGTVAVSGSSMSPTYVEGDWLLVRWRPTCQPGDVIVIEREDRPGVYLIKRYLRQEEAGLWVEGDSPASTDSRQWGPINQSEVVGKVLFRLRRERNAKK